MKNKSFLKAPPNEAQSVVDDLQNSSSNIETSQRRIRPVRDGVNALVSVSKFAGGMIRDKMKRASST